MYHNIEGKVVLSTAYERSEIKQEKHGTILTALMLEIFTYCFYLLKYNNYPWK